MEKELKKVDAKIISANKLEFDFVMSYFNLKLILQISAESITYKAKNVAMKKTGKKYRLSAKVKRKVLIK